MTHLDNWYHDILKKIMNQGSREKNNRTGHETASLPGITYRTDLQTDGFPILTLRQLNLKAPVAEQIWFIAGQKRPDVFLNNFTKIWEAFTENNGEVEAAYGYRWRHHFAKDQLENLVIELKKDKTNRQGVVVTWDPSTDGPGSNKKKNVPCPFAFTVNIIGDRLNLHNFVRSNDMILGFSFDVFGFALLMCILAQEIGVKPGVFTHTISSAHIYDIHYDAAEELLKRSNYHPNVFINKWPHNFYERAKQLDESLVTQTVRLFEEQYRPLGKLSKLEIVK